MRTPRFDMINIAYATFGQSAPEAGPSKQRAVLWALCAVFVIIGTLITIALNFFSLFAGVMITFLGRDGVKFNFLSFFGHVPVVAIGLPVLFGYALWHHSGENGWFITVLPFFGVWLLGAALIALTGFLQR